MLPLLTRDGSPQCSSTGPLSLIGDVGLNIQVVQGN